MTESENDELNRLLAKTVRGMVEYLDANDAGEEEDASYTAQEVEACRSILVRHADLIEDATDAAQGLEIVRQTVEQLNELNAKAGDELIETDQREDICMYLIRCGFLRGFNRFDEDITEEWREW